MHIPKPVRMAFQKIGHHAPSIMTGVAVLGVLSTTILAVKATPEALRRMEAHKHFLEEEYSLPFDEIEKLSYRDAFLVSWRAYVPAALSGAATISCIIGAHSVSAKRQAAVLGAYTLADSALREFKAKTIETFGEKGVQKVHDGIATERVAADMKPGNEIIVWGDGDVLCCEVMTGRYFKSDREKLRKAQNDINFTVNNNMYASHNDFYQMLGIPQNAMGEDLGWTTENHMEMVWSSALTPEGKPCLTFDYVYQPKPNYHKIW